MKRLLPLLLDSDSVVVVRGAAQRGPARRHGNAENGGRKKNDHDHSHRLQDSHFMLLHARSRTALERLPVRGLASADETCRLGRGGNRIMQCVACNAENASDRRFCGGCGAALQRECAGCGFANQADVRFCGGW